MVRGVGQRREPTTIEGWQRDTAPTAPLPTLRTPSMQPEHAVDGAQFGRLDQLGMRDGDGV
jgi:hypothetical protein